MRAVRWIFVASLFIIAAAIPSESYPKTRVRTRLNIYIGFGAPIHRHPQRFYYDPGHHYRYFRPAFVGPRIVEVMRVNYGGPRRKSAMIHLCFSEVTHSQNGDLKQKQQPMG